jgi:hypothetical protein
MPLMVSETIEWFLGDGKEAATTSILARCGKPLDATLEAIRPLHLLVHASQEVRNGDQGVRQNPIRSNITDVVDAYDADP